MNNKTTTIDDLARMINEGFTATTSKEDLVEVRQEMQAMEGRLTTRLDHLDARVGRIEADMHALRDEMVHWSGVAPGNDESAGKKRSGKTRPGNQALRTGLSQLAHAAARTKGTYLSALYQRLAARRGKKRAIVAVAHSIVVSAFHMLSRNESSRELGASYFDDHRRAHLVDQLTRRIERLGYRVTLEPVAAA
jgi:hypothetical protein